MASANLWNPGTTDVPSMDANDAIVIQRFVATASQTLFTLTAFTYTLGTNSLQVYKNGLLLSGSGVNYTETSTSSFTLASGASLNDVVVAIGMIAITGTVVTPADGSVTTAKLASGFTLPIADGGTGQGTAAAALAALGGATSGIITSSGLTIGTGKLAGRSTAATGALEEISVGTGLSLLAGVLSASLASIYVPVRQTVLSGTVDSNGLASFGGSTGSTTVTTSTTLTVTAANGFTSAGALDLVGQKTNPSWTGLSTNGIMYLGVTVNADGTLTEFSTTLAPTYQWGGTYSTTSNQRTFNIQEMIMKVGNGSSASQAYQTFVGQVTVTGGVVTAIVWYQPLGRYKSALVATLPAMSSVTTFSHNLGYKANSVEAHFVAVNTTTQNGWAVGDEYVEPFTRDGSGTLQTSTKPQPLIDGLSMITATQSDTYKIPPAAGGDAVTVTRASWSYYATAKRSW